nr:MAG TPA: hypothetical protein [Caudoviricetes sp.]
MLMTLILKPFVRPVGHLLSLHIKILSKNH